MTRDGSSEFKKAPIDQTIDTHVSYRNAEVYGSGVALETACFVSPESGNESVLSYPENGFTAVISDDLGGWIKHEVESAYRQSIRAHEKIGVGVETLLEQTYVDNLLIEIFQKVADAVLTTSPTGYGEHPSLTISQLIHSDPSLGANGARLRVMSIGTHAVGIQRSSGKIEEIATGSFDAGDSLRGTPSKAVLETANLKAGDNLIITNAAARDLVHADALPNETPMEIVRRFASNDRFMQLVPSVVQHYIEASQMQAVAADTEEDDEGALVPLILKNKNRKSGLFWKRVLVGGFLAGLILATWRAFEAPSERDVVPLPTTTTSRVIPSPTVTPPISSSALPTTAAPKSVVTYPTKGECGYDDCQPNQPKTTVQAAPKPEDYPLKAVKTGGACYEKTLKDERGYMALQKCGPYTNPSMVAFGQLWQMYGGQGKNINYAQIDAVDAAYAAMMGVSARSFNRLPVGAQIPLLSKDELVKTLGNTFGPNLGFSVKPTGDNRSDFANCA